MNVVGKWSVANVRGIMITKTRTMQKIAMIFAISNYPKQLSRNLKGNNKNNIGATMTDREKMILVIVDEVLHSGLSIDTEADQDYVCEVIRKRIEEELF